MSWVSEVDADEVRTGPDERWHRAIVVRTDVRGRRVETLQFILANLPAIGERTLQHIAIVGVAVGLAILTG